MLDMIPTITIAIFIIFGAYRGFTISAIKTACFFLALLSALLSYPIFTGILGGSGYVNAIIEYTEGSSKIYTSEENYNVPYSNVNEFTDAQLDEIVNTSSLVYPYKEKVRETMKDRTYEKYNLTTVGDYFDYTVAFTTINIISFLVSFIVLRLAFGALINLVDYVRPFPVLKHFDTIAGGLLGFVGGYFFCYLLFSVIPIALTIVNNSFAYDFVAASSAAEKFYGASIILDKLSATL